MTSNTAHATFMPDYAFPPGEHLQDWLEENHVSQTELAERTELSRKHISQLINGEATLSTEVAATLERVTGMPARLWNRLEADFRSWQEAQRRQARLADDAYSDWAKTFPIPELQGRGLLPDVDGSDLVEALLRLFGVNSVDSWFRLYQQRVTGVAYRVAAGERDFCAVAAWLRACDLRASRIRTSPYDRSALLSLAADVRHTSLKDPAEMWAILVDRYAECGVALVLEPEFPASTKLNGASWWETPDRAVIAVTGRRKRADGLLFTILHETAHVAYHAKKAVYIDIEASTPDRPDLEVEADERAARWLIPRSEWKSLRLLPLHPKGLGRIRNAAAKHHIHPGILIGQLQHENNNFSVGSSLKQSLDLTDDHWGYSGP